MQPNDSQPHRERSRAKPTLRNDPSRAEKTGFYNPTWISYWMQATQGGLTLGKRTLGNSGSQSLKEPPGQKLGQVLHQRDI